MKHALLAAAAILVVGAPAFADSTVTIEKKTITREEPGSGSTVSTVVIAPNPPPPPQAEVPPPPPGPTMVWTGGHWRWDPETRSYVWLQGKYMTPPHERAAWMPGHWRQGPDGWMWDEGHWD
jgi:hypothetical protein